MSRRDEPSMTSAHPRAAFTLIEMLVVIVIIGVLASIVGPTIFRNIGDSKSSAAKSQVELLSLALNAYRQYLATTPSGTDAPAARRQIKDLESASPSERSAQESSPSSGEDQ